MSMVMEQSIIEEMYQSIDNLINKICWNFVWRCGGEFEDYKSECLLKFTEVVVGQKYQSGRGILFSTWLYTVMQNALTSMVRKRMKDQGRLRIDSQFIDNLQPVATDSNFEDRMETLSEDARVVVEMVCNPPDELDGLKPRTGLRRLRNYLWSNDWDMPRITDTFSEIRIFLGATK